MPERTACGLLFCRGRDGPRPSSKYEKIAAMRRESRAAMRKRQLKDLDLSAALAGPDTMRECAAVLAGDSLGAVQLRMHPTHPLQIRFCHAVNSVPPAAIHSTGPPEVVTTSSFEEEAWAPRTYMHGAFGGERAAFLGPATAAAPSPQAALAEALEQHAQRTKQRCVSGKKGKFVCRPDQVAMAAAAAR